MLALYSHMPRPFWRALAVSAQSNGRAVKTALLKKGFSIGEKIVSPSVFDAVRSVVSVENLIFVFVICIAKKIHLDYF